MKVCAMVDRSAGNESVGEMWTETAVFDETDSIAEVFAWARADYRVNVKLSVLQDAKGRTE